MTISVDFRQGAVNSFAASGSPSYSSNGVSFAVSRSRDAPQLASVFYIMFGRVEITMKAAPGAGIVSSLVLQADSLDEIDIEWLGSNPDEIQSNYFGKGQTTTYNRGQFHAVSGTQANFITYTIDWTQDRIVWMAGDKVLRELKASDAEANQYPQTPMQVKFGAWAGGDASANAPGTVDWARGPTDFSKGPFSMLVQKVVVTDYSTGKQYKYKDTSGTWQSIEAIDGSVNGNFNKANSLTVTATPPGAATTGIVPIPVGGMAKDGSPATATRTEWPWVAGASPSGGPLPGGWHMTPNGKIMRSNASALQKSTSLATVILGPVMLAWAVLSRLW
ncbi:extracellular cell wall glucanase Crf1 [Metarhizium album ARSEF 1941]|uniref:chitinase n=1 Tax=Metarhizium album (strain ARSEF 1941) TaxID=1081103 RepID=A0A0B2WJT7_METAS|nr:extracellular cell wall glucanase Crf1 [Metarhizium album ARSEF 1941]KHN96276.1 extracellular cell wall glucanase Crf1 [Metarhizium album ARSEF 1941]